MPNQLPTILEARARILEVVRGPLSVEQIPVSASLDRFLVHDVTAARNAPPFDSSAMDGYGSHAGPAGRTLRIVGESRAGTPFEGVIGPDQAIRISTGASVPSDAAAVIRQEDVIVVDDGIRTAVAVARGENIRRAGEDMRAGEVLLRAGSRIRPSAIGVAIGAGAGMLTVARKPRVTVLCTGDELRAPGEPLGPGQIHNSNGPMLSSLATRCGASVELLTDVRDDFGATEKALQRALEQSDVVILSGGVSVGPHDHVRPALAALGVTAHIAGVALQPGRPTWFGSLGEKFVFGLAGNPVSAVVTFALFAAPALRALQGADPAGPRRCSALLDEPIRRRPDRERAICVTLTLSSEATIATPTGVQASHLVTSLYEAEAVAMIPAGAGDMPAGSAVEIEPLIR